jgi:hypothetical protein
MGNHQIVFGAMRENRRYNSGELAGLTGLSELGVCSALIKLQAGGLILNMSPGKRPKNRLYMTRQTMLDLEQSGPGKLHLALTDSEPEKKRSEA